MYLREIFEFESYSLAYSGDAMHRSVFCLPQLDRLARLRLRTQQTIDMHSHVYTYVISILVTYTMYVLLKEI